MTCCGRKGVEPSTPDNTWVNMAYVPKDGSTPKKIDGYNRRHYLVRQGWSGLVHPDDVYRLERNGQFVRVQLPQPQAVIVEPVEVTEPIKEISASAAVIKLAEANGIDLQTVEGSGRGGKIVKRDIEALIGNG